MAHFLLVGAIGLQEDSLLINVDHIESIEAQSEKGKSFAMISTSYSETLTDILYDKFMEIAKEDNLHFPGRHGVIGWITDLTSFADRSQPKVRPFKLAPSFSAEASKQFNDAWQEAVASGVAGPLFKEEDFQDLFHPPTSELD